MVRPFPNYGLMPLLRLSAGAAGVHAVNEELAKRWRDRFFRVDSSNSALGDTRSAERRIDKERSAVLAFAVIGGIAIVGFLSLTLLRQFRREEADARSPLLWRWPP